MDLSSWLLVSICRPETWKMYLQYIYFQISTRGLNERLFIISQCSFSQKSLFRAHPHWHYLFPSKGERLSHVHPPKREGRSPGHRRGRSGASDWVAIPCVLSASTWNTVGHVKRRVNSPAGDITLGKAGTCSVSAAGWGLVTFITLFFPHNKPMVVSLSFPPFSHEEHK